MRSRSNRGQRDREGKKVRGQPFKRAKRLHLLTASARKIEVKHDLKQKSLKSDVFSQLRIRLHRGGRGQPMLGRMPEGGSS